MIGEATMQSTFHVAVGQVRSIPMLPSSTSGWLSILVAVIAAIVAGIALWSTHFAKGHLIWAVSTASLAIAKWDSDEDERYTPDIAIPMSIANTGTQPVTVNGLRVRVRYVGLPIPNAYEIWTLNCELDLETELTMGMGRTSLVALKRFLGTPFIILPKTNVDKRFVFWCRWEKPVEQKMVFDLEAQTSKGGEWKLIDSWRFELTANSWTDFVDQGSRLGLMTADQHVFDHAPNPEDLHKYTGPTKKMTKSKATGKSRKGNGT